MFWIVLVVALFAVGPFALEARKRGASRAEIGKAPGGLAQLSDGKTYYEWHGPVDGDILVCVHGLSTPSFIWEGLMRNFTTMGYRVLSYDLYGRGLSDAPSAPQTRELFLRQLRELLAHQHIDEFSLAGFSMGGQIAMAQAAEEAERVERLILLAPAGFGVARSPFMSFVQSRGRLGEWLFLGLGARAMKRQNRRLAHVETAVPDLVARQNAQIKRRGYMRSVLSSMRNMLSDSAEADMAEIKRSYVPVLAIWGERDQLIPTSAVGALAQANRDARQVTVKGASHWLPATHPGEITRAVTEFRRET